MCVRAFYKRLFFEFWSHDGMSKFCVIRCPSIVVLLSMVADVDQLHANMFSLSKFKLVLEFPSIDSL